MDHRRMAKFVHLLPTSFRIQNHKFSVEPLAIKFFGCSGTVIKEETNRIQENLLSFEEKRHKENLKDFLEGAIEWESCTEDLKWEKFDVEIQGG